MAEHALITTDRRTPAAPAAPERRSLFSFITAIACMPVLGVSAVPDPDAGLIRLCAAFHEADQASDAADDLSWEAHLDRRWQISDAIEAMTPTTDAGRLAKARVALVLMEECSNVSNSYEQFALSALRDLVGGAA